MIDQEKNDAEELRRQVVSNIYLFFFFWASSVFPCVNVMMMLRTDWGKNLIDHKSASVNRLLGPGGQG